jgi:hypothetical protein
MTFGQGVAPDSSRERISALAAAPTILGLLGVERSPGADAAAPLAAKASS